jgi:outer membrane protein
MRFLAGVCYVAASLAVASGNVTRLDAQSPRERLTLKDAEQRAVDGHPQVQAGRSAALAASQVVREVKSAYWPTVFGSVTGAASSPDGARITAGALNNPSIYDRFAAGVTVSQLITDFGRTGDLAQTQTLRANAQEQNATRVRAEVLLRVDQTYFDGLRAQAVLRVARQTVEARQLVADQVTALAASNLKSGLDVSFARVNLSQAQLLLVQAQSDVDASFAALGAAMGSSAPATYDLVDEPMPPPPPDDAAPLVAQAFRGRPDLAAEQLADQAAAKLAEAEHALWYPTVAAVGMAGVTPYHQEPLTDHYAAAGFNVTVPIANGSLYSARHAEAAHRAEVEDEALRDLQNQITRDVTLAWLQARTGYQRVDLTNQLLAHASDALELAQARYNLGLSSIVELTQAQLNKTQAEIDQATVRYEYQARTAALRFQTGMLK